MTPRKSPSSPMGISSGAIPAPSFSLSSSSVRVKDARSRSSLLTKTTRGVPSRSAIAQMISVPTSTPSTAETTKIARSATRRAVMTSQTKSAYPGVSMRLILYPSNSSGASANEMDIRWRTSSGSKSQTVEPSSTRPGREVAGLSASRASASVVLPVPTWPTRAMLRIFSDG